MIKADFVTEVRQLIANHVGDCKGEGGGGGHNSPILPFTSIVELSPVRKF